MLNLSLHYLLFRDGERSARGLALEPFEDEAAHVVGGHLLGCRDVGVEFLGSEGLGEILTELITDVGVVGTAAHA